MPSEYSPDLWTLLEITSPAGERHFRVLASWVGGYLGSDSWKMSSGITKIEECEGEYRVHNESGSIYLCRKGAQGMTGFASGVLANYQVRARAAGAAIENLDSVADVAVPFEPASRQGSP